jgi:hypothetical protein
MLANSLYHADLRNKIGLLRTSFFAVILQLVVIIINIVVIVVFGEKPDSALAYFESFFNNALVTFLRDDLFSILLIVLYLFSFSGLFFLLKNHHFSLAFFATLLTFCAVILSMNAYSGFSMMHLSNNYWAATDESVRLQIIAAGEAVIAKNNWNSSAGFFAGTFLQGAGVLMSIAMIGNSNFRKITLAAGIISNGLDLINHFLHYGYPDAANLLISIAGPIYIVWYLMIAIDLYRVLKGCC